MSKVLSVKIREDGAYGCGSFEYKNKVDLSNYKMLAILLFDLWNNGANIEKAFKEFIKLREDDSFPF
jgi:hypothetical protein